MRRAVMVGAWAAVTGLAISLAWGAVSLVANGVTDPRPEALPPAEVLAALRAPATGRRQAQPAPTLANVPSPGSQAGNGSGVGTDRTASTTPGTAPAASPPAGAAAPGGPPSAAPTTVPAPGAERTGPVEDGRSPPPGNPPPANPSPAPDSTRAFATPGGVVTVGCYGSAISLVSARPNDGYAVIVHNSGPEQVEVEFTSGSSADPVRARCANGQPTASPDE